MIRLLSIVLLTTAVVIAAYNAPAFIRTTATPNDVPERATTLISQPKFDRVGVLSSTQLPKSIGARRSDSFPDVKLIDQSGRSHSFREDLVRDKIVCIAFFYTQCTGTCPGTIQTMKRLRESLKDEFPAKSLQFIAVSLDPEQDQPADLLEYANERGIVPSDDLAEWLFCTGTLDDVESLRRGLGLYDLDPELDADRTQHAALLTIGNDRTNRWTALPSGLSYDDLSETFFRIAGTTEKQRFATRIARSAQWLPATAASTTSTCCNGHPDSENPKCCSSKKECCSAPDAKP